MFDSERGEQGQRGGVAAALRSAELPSPPRLGIEWGRHCGFCLVSTALCRAEPLHQGANANL